MNKRVLVKIPEDEAKKEYISLAKRVEKALYFVSAKIAESEKEKILLLNFYSQCDLRDGNTRAAFRVFLNQDDYITQDLKSTKLKWKTASLRNLVDKWHWHEWCVCVDDQTEKAIREFIKSGKTVFAGLEDFQESVMKKRLAKKHKRITDKIDEQMELISDLPQNFNEWIEETVLFKSRYIYYEYKAGRKHMKGFCTYCKKDLLVEKPRHNLEGTCPKCQSPITFKALGKSKLVIDYAEAAILQNVKTGFVIRFFKVKREFKDHYRKPKTYWFEAARDFYSGSEIKSYEWADFRQTGVRWCDYNGKWYFGKTAVYPDTIDEVLKDTKWKYSALKEFAIHKPGFGFDVNKYLSTYKHQPFIEYLVKLKLYQITNEVIHGYGSQRIDSKGKNLQEILKIDKAHLLMIQNMNASLDELRLIQVMEKEELNLSAEQIRYISEMIGCATSLLEMGRYTTVNKALNYIKAQAQKKKSNQDESTQCMHSAWARSGKESKIANTYSDWMDYVGFCKELKYDLKNEFILYPKNLKDAHDRAAELVKAKRDREEAKKQQRMKNKIKSMAKELTERYGMNYKGLMILAPKDSDEIIKEGQSLHHCVGTYIKKIAEGSSIVLFVRKEDKPEESYCTLEIVDGKITQCRGKNNADMKEKVKKILKKFEKTKLSPLVEKEAM